MTLLRFPRSACLGLFAITVALAGGCSRNDPAQLIKSARDYQAKGEHRAAVIQLKNAVQKQPENGEARFLLGQSSLQTGDPLSAEKEFRKALEYGQSKDVVTPLLAQAMLEAGAADKVVSEFAATTLADPKSNAELQVRIGEAQLRLRRLPDAAAAFKRALASDPSNVRAQLAQVRLLAFDGKLADAIAAVGPVVAANPRSTEALVLQSELQFAAGDRAAARASMQKAIEINPSQLEPRLELIALLVSDNDFEAAAQQLDAARGLRPDDLRVQYFDGLVAVGRKDFAKARDIAQQLLKKAPEHVPTLAMAGGIELQEKHYATAESYLQRALTLDPQHTGARTLLARSYLASNQPARAVDVLQPLLARGSRVDAPTLMLAGEASLAAGDATQAATYFEAAAKSGPEESAARVRLGQIALARGDVEGGVRTLEGVVAQGGSAQAELALIAGYMRQGNQAKALQAAQDLVKKNGTATSYQVLGAVQLSRKDVPAARAAYGKALEIDPAFLPAAAALARLDLADGKPADARGRFEAVLAKDPKNDLALLGLAETMVAAKQPAAEIVAVIQRAVAARPESAVARVALVNFYLSNKDPRAALTAAQEAAAAVGQDTRVLDALGRAQAASGEYNQAIETFNRVAAAEPTAVVPLVRLAALYVERKDPDKAVEVLLRAQRIAPNDANLTRNLVVAYMMQGKPDEALKQARAYQKLAPKSPAGYILEGEAFASTQQYAQAERVFREGLKADPTSPILAIRLHSALAAGGKRPEADAFARKHLQEQPNDMAFRTYMAEQALGARDFKGAVAQYQIILAKQPDDVAALNNMAWAMGQLGDPKALAVGERALKLAPQSPLILDTVGVLLLAQGDTGKAVDTLSRAVAAAPERHDIRLNYAKALLKAGRKDDARRELTQLEAVKQDFPGKAEVAALLKQ